MALAKTSQGLALASHGLAWTSQGLDLAFQGLTRASPHLAWAWLKPLGQMDGQMEGWRPGENYLVWNHRSLTL